VAAEGEREREKEREEERERVGERGREREGGREEGREGAGFDTGAWIEAGRFRSWKASIQEQLLYRNVPRF